VSAGGLQSASENLGQTSVAGAGGRLGRVGIASECGREGQHTDDFWGASTSP